MLLSLTQRIGLRLQSRRQICALRILPLAVITLLHRPTPPLCTRLLLWLLSKARLESTVSSATVCRRTTSVCRTATRGRQSRLKVRPTIRSGSSNLKQAKFKKLRSLADLLTLLTLVRPASTPPKLSQPSWVKTRSQLLRTSHSDSRRNSRSQTSALDRTLTARSAC